MKQADRERKKAWKERERADARAGFPLAGEQLASLFQFVETSVDGHDCDHSRRFTEQWLKNEGAPRTAVIEWLESNGGFCDCEVIYNAQDHWEQNR